MRYFFLCVTVCAYLHSLLAAMSGDAGYAIGLLGGAGAWTMITSLAFDVGA